MRTSFLVSELFFFLVLLICNVCANEDEKICEMEETLDALSNKVTELREQFAAFRGETCTSAEGNEDVLPLIPLEASRKYIDGSVEHTVKYRTSQPCEIFISWDKEYYNDGFRTENVNRGMIKRPAGEWTTTLVTERGTERVMLGLFASYLSYRLTLSNDPESSNGTVHISLPPLKIEPAGDIVYDEGKDVTLKVEFPLEAARAPPASYLDTTSMRAFVFTVDPTSKDFTYFEASDKPRLFEEPESKTTMEDSREFVFALKTSTYPLSGWITFAVGENNYTSLVQRIEMGKRKFVRPSSQTAPLPPGYVGVTSYIGEKNQDTGEVEQWCSYNYVDCEINCVAAGNELADLTVTKLLPDGSQQPVDFDIKMKIDAFQMEGILNAKATSQNINDATYTCTASNPEGNSKTLAIKVIYFAPVHIIHEASGVTWLNEDQVNVTCVASGKPLPTIEISTVMQILDNVDTIVLADNSVMASKIVDISAVSEGRPVDYPMSASDYGFTCRARAAHPNWNEDTFNLEVPDKNL